MSRIVKGYKIVGTFGWENDEIFITDVSWGEPFSLPGKLLEIVTEADEPIKKIIPEAELAIVIPKEYYPYPF
jgi:hypothetical protein